MHYLAQEVKDAVATGVELAVVVGGGKHLARAQTPPCEAWSAPPPTTRASGGRSSTPSPSRTRLEQMGVDTRTQSALAVQAVAGGVHPAAGDSPPGEGRVVIFAGRDGQSLHEHGHGRRASGGRDRRQRHLHGEEQVDGVYDADPRQSIPTPSASTTWSTWTC